MKEYLKTKIGDIADEDIQNLLNHLEEITTVSKEAFFNSTLWSFLSQCVYPNGAGEKRIKIEKRDVESIDPTGRNYLLQKIRKLNDTEIYEVYLEICKMRSLSPELEDGKALYNFLNLHLPNDNKRKKKRKQIRYF
jgi:hypothetical protein